MKFLCLCLLAFCLSGCAAFQGGGLHLTKWVIEEHWPEDPWGRAAMAPVMAPIVVATGAADYAVIHPLYRIECAGQVSWIGAQFLGGSLILLVRDYSRDDWISIVFFLAPAWALTFPPTWVVMSVVPCLTCPDEWLWSWIYPGNYPEAQGDPD